jgi:AcrR family transcriptional regulator
MDDVVHDAVIVEDSDVFDPEDEESLTPTQTRIRTRQVAVLFCCGYSFAQISEEIGINPKTVTKYFKTQECQRDIAKINNSDLNLVRSRLREVLLAMCDRLIEDIKDNTPECYKAIKHVAQIFGFTEHKKPEDTPITDYQIALKAVLAPNDPPTEELVPSMALLPAKPASSKAKAEPVEEEEEDDSEVEF